MSKSLIPYSKELPELVGRRPFERPTQHLVKDLDSPTGWRVQNGRRASVLLLVEKLRSAVDKWRESGYLGASDVTRRLFEYWFEEDHELESFESPMRFHFCQREAIETLAYLVEVEELRDTIPLIERFASVVDHGLLSPFSFTTDMHGCRKVICQPLASRDTSYDLPPEDLSRYAFRMATGSGKTWVMALVMVWARFHKIMVTDSPLSTNFLIVAPNVIVYQRLERDFGSNQIFNELKLVPPEWRSSFRQKTIIRGDSAEPEPSYNVFLTNIQQLYESREKPWEAINPVDMILGKKPVKGKIASGERMMIERIKSLKDLIVINDEAHHVHDDDLEWNKTLMSIHHDLPKGLSLWLDFSATPKDQSGQMYPWTICDYPLAQAVEDRIIKAPIIVTREADPDYPLTDPENVTASNVCDKFSFWLTSGVARWREHYQVLKKLGQKPVLFIMAEQSAHADAIGEYLVNTEEFGFKRSEVLVIHTDKKGEVSSKDLEKAREAARDIDKKESKIKAIVSVMMLREGWDVKNVTVVVGLRPYSASKILPEQVIGRGTRLMTNIGPERTQTLEVLGTRRLIEQLRNELETEGVSYGVTKDEPMPPVVIEPVLEKLYYDISIPITKPWLQHVSKRLSDISINDLGPIYENVDLDKRLVVNLKLEFATTHTQVHQTDIGTWNFETAHLLIGTITNKIIANARLTGCFSSIYPIVEQYISEKCFGCKVQLDATNVKEYLNKLPIKEGIAKYLSRRISELIVEERDIEFERRDYKLSETKPFTWRRNMPPLFARKTVFNYVATYNDFEKQFASFLDYNADDVLRFASLGTTEQGTSGTRFRVDYLKPNGAIGFYFPDWVAVQKTPRGEVNWIIETKGRVFESTSHKDKAILEWCRRISEQSGSTWKYCRINQKQFDPAANSLEALIQNSELFE